MSILVAEMQDIVPWLEPAGNVRHVKSAERTLALFELFSLHQRPMTVAEITRALGIPQPSASMLLRNLTVLGYLEYDRVHRTYIPSIRIMLLGSWVQRQFSEQGLIERRLDHLSAQLCEVLKMRATVILGIQNVVYSQYVLVRMPQNPDLLVQSGMLRPITCTSVGKMLLSQKSDAEVEALVRRCNAEVADERQWVRPKEFVAEMHTVRRNGYAETCGTMSPGRSTIAVPVVGTVATMPMAVAVGGLSAQIQENRDAILSALCEFQIGYKEAIAGSFDQRASAA
ncbi:helix-turn-helix domain-containing protein [Sphingobium sp. JS3065]|jgi:DNA-binding IclR family transcriptional regulator|uniref:IclR family transcriptional regulator n=1 Tax=Sphingobium sp. JS3065 TaxID=2970925 RepID=UPI002263D91B|nr:helix-turn-helix domain-containing protein [Sphingobium sp. JS3065]UZW53681.1 helix-turn-helix domain-containing protein [Sphingobium sp. JS3065]